MASIHLPIRQLVEFLLRTGSIDSRFAGFDRANEGARIHRKLQKATGEGYQAEVFLSAEREVCGIAFTLEGRADGIFTDENGRLALLTGRTPCAAASRRSLPPQKHGWLTRSATTRQCNSSSIPSGTH